MPKALCGNYPCLLVCSRVNHCPAGLERCQWLAKVRNPSRKAPAGVNPLTGEIITPRYNLHKLNHLGENRQHVSFTPVHQVSAAPPAPAAHRSLKVSLDKLVSEAGFPEKRDKRPTALYRSGAAYWFSRICPAEPASKKVRISVLIVLAVLAALIIWGSFSTYHYEPGRAEVGHTYNNNYEYDY